MSMNLIKTFEERMNTIFGSSTEGFTAPFSIKKLAKRAAREMEAETFEIDGSIPLLLFIPYWFPPPMMLPCDLCM